MTLIALLASLLGLQFKEAYQNRSRNYRQGPNEPKHPAHDDNRNRDLWRLFKHLQNLFNALRRNGWHCYHIASYKLNCGGA